MSRRNEFLAALCVLALACGVAPPAWAGPRTARLLVAISNNVGDPDEAPLEFADDDALRISAVFTELGDVDRDRATVLTNTSANQVRQHLAETRGRLFELAKQGYSVELFIYVSGHADRETLHLGGTRLPFEEIRNYVLTSSASVRLLIIDTCQSGALVRNKGARPVPEFVVRLEPEATRGMVVISSSGSDEASQEWPTLKGALFTHHLLTGLRGNADADGNGRVTLFEAFNHASTRTVASAAFAGQHPKFDVDLSGTQDVTLTRPDNGRSRIVFPKESSGQFVVASQPRPSVVAELEKQAGRELRLAVPPGRYLVRKRMGPQVGLTTVEIPFGGSGHVDESTLRVVHFSEVSLKGGQYFELHENALLLGGALWTEPLTGTGARWMPVLSFRRTFASWWITGAIAGTAVRFTGNGLTTAEWDGIFTAGAGYRWLDWAFVPLIGVTLDVLVLHQQTTADAVPSQPALYRWVAGMAPGALLGLELPLGDRFLGRVTAKTQTRWLRAEGQSEWSFGAAGSAEIGFRW